MLLTLPSMAQKAGDVLPECRTEAEARQRAARYFTGEEIPDEVFRRMRGKSFPAGCTVKRSDLRYLRMLHRNREGRTQVGRWSATRPSPATCSAFSAVCMRRATASSA